MGMYCSFVAFPPRKLKMLEEDPELPGDLLTTDEMDVPNRLSIGKAWDALHFGLTGLTQLEGEGPLANAISGSAGRPIGSDLAYGPAKLLEPEQVGDVAKALERFPNEHLVMKYQAGHFRDHELHGDYGMNPKDTDDLGELLEQLDRLRTFYLAAAKRGDYVITAIT